MNTKNLKTILLMTLMSVIIVLQSYSLKAQSDFEKQLNAIASDLAVKIATSGKIKIAISDFIDNNGKQTELGQAIAEELTVNLINSGKGLQVMERSQLKSILKEHQLASTGLIDPETAKQLGKLKMVDAIIVGTLTPFGEALRLSVKVLDTETGMGIAASKGEIARTDAINKLFAGEVQSSAGAASPTKTTSSQQPTTNEKIPNCEEKKIGHLCFTNKTSKKIRVYLIDPSGAINTAQVTLLTDENQCFYNVPANAYSYEAHEDNGNYVSYSNNSPPPFKKLGNVLLEQCEKKVIEIKDK